MGKIDKKEYAMSCIQLNVILSNLSEKEKIEIKSLKRGEALMFVGEEHILAKIDVADFEQKLIN